MRVYIQYRLCGQLSTLINANQIRRLLNDYLMMFNVGGGVWRTKWNILDDSSSFIFLSCMQGGSSIVEYDGANSICAVKIQQRDENNDNHLAYGIDIINVAPLQGLESSNLGEYSEKTVTDVLSSRALTVTVASCSFYDNLVQVWDAVL